jgi:radical SAM protein with 4Fe4S-binding SPASM domain
MRRKGKISLDDFKKIVDEIHKDVCYLSLYFQGEPFMHPDFFQLVDYAKKNKIFISTSTNGHFLSEKNILSLIHSRLDLLIISLDGVTAESYEKYRKGGDFEKVVENIKSLTKKKKEYGVKYPLIELQFIVFKHNEKEIKDFKNLAGNLNVDKVTIKTAQIYSHDPEILPSSENKYSRYRYDESGNLFLLKKNKRGCSRQWSQCVITWEGEMAPCCFDKEASFSFGNVLANGVYPIWENQKNILFRQNIIKKRYPSLCKDCPEI